MILKAPQQGFPVTADWGREVADSLRRMRLQAGPGLKLAKTPEGQTISLARRPAQDAADPMVWPQWRCELATNRDGDPALYVGTGRLAWGGAHNATWQGRQLSLGLPPSSRSYLIWFTKCAPIAYEACLAEAPAGPVCADVEAKAPAEFTPDVGSVGLFERAARQDGWTDAHLLAVIERGEDGAYAIDQVQVAEIAVHAVVNPGETPADPTPEEEVENECGAGGGLSDFPSNIDDSSTAWRDFPVGWGELGIRFPSKVAACW